MQLWSRPDPTCQAKRTATHIIHALQQCTASTTLRIQMFIVRSSPHAEHSISLIIPRQQAKMTQRAKMTQWVRLTPHSNFTHFRTSPNQRVQTSCSSPPQNIRCVIPTSPNQRVTSFILLWAKTKHVRTYRCLVDPAVPPSSQKSEWSNNYYCGPWASSLLTWLL